MSEAVLNNFLYNGNSYEVNKFDTIYKDIYPSVYEVIRIINGIPLFLEEHYERLTNSVKLTGNNLNVSIDELKSNILKVIKSNNVSSYNIKYVINNLSDSNRNQYYFFINTSYPSNDMYTNGVKTFLYKAVRENPQAKVINHSLRDDVNRLLKSGVYFEALLVNDKDEITEGSRSNTFFIKGSSIYTAPPEDVLLGVTRQRIIRLCRENSIDVIETPIKVSNIKSYDAAFISGTSPKVLPIASIGDIKYDINNATLKKAMDIYDNEISNYIKSHK